MNQWLNCCVFFSRDCTRHTGADAVGHLFQLHFYLGRDGRYEVHHLHGRRTREEGQSGLSRRGHLHHRRSVHNQLS